MPMYDLTTKQGIESMLHVCSTIQTPSIWDLIFGSSSEKISEMMQMDLANKIIGDKSIKEGEITISNQVATGINFNRSDVDIQIGKKTNSTMTIKFKRR